MENVHPGRIYPFTRLDARCTGRLDDIHHLCPELHAPILDGMRDATEAVVRPRTSAKATLDHAPTICAISVIAIMLSTMLHEGLGHAAVAIVTLHASGTLTSLAWSSSYDSRLVMAGGTIVNLIAGFVFWLLLRAAKNSRPSVRFFFLISMAFNLLAGTGYFFFSGVSNFGDWAGVIQGLHPHWLLRVALVVVGVASYYGAIVLVGVSTVRYMGVEVSDARRFRRLLWVPYFAALIIDGIAGVFNPFGWQYVFLSALAATAGGNCGLLWLRYYLPKRLQPGERAAISRSYAWIAVAAVLAAVFVVVFGPGVHLQG
ncbi:MAG: hypothetical protein ACRD3F_00845 [Acidobacteriaceae bacterium]